MSNKKDNQFSKLYDYFNGDEDSEVEIENYEDNYNKMIEAKNKKKNYEIKNKEKEKLKQEAEKEYQKDLQDIKKIMDSIHQEDINYKNEDERKKNIAKQYMYNAYKEKEERKRREMEEEKLQRERERQHQENVDKRESDLNDKKAQIQQEKDKRMKKILKI